MSQYESIEIPINITHHTYSNCIQDIFVTYLKWKKEEFEKLFDHTWSFGYFGVYQPDVYRDGFSPIFESLKRNFGLEVVIKNYNFDEIYSELKKQRLVGACVDTYYCYWHRSFKKYHNQHYILISGFKEMALMCIDPYTSKKVERINLDEIDLVINEILYIYTIGYEPTNWKENVIRHQKDILGLKDGNNDFQKMKNFADDLFKERESLIKEINNYENIAFWPFLLKLNNIGYGRKCYSIYLTFIGVKYKKADLSEFVALLDEFANEWTKISTLFIKYKVTGFSATLEKRIYEKILYLAAEEEKTAKRLLMTLQ